MSKFYGTLTNDRGFQSTRTGHQNIKATAQSWSGSVSVELYEKDGEIIVQVKYDNDTSTANPFQSLFTCKLSEISEVLK